MRRLFAVPGVPVEMLADSAHALYEVEGPCRPGRDNRYVHTVSGAPVGWSSTLASAAAHFRFIVATREMVTRWGRS